jgi:hypothetical protein
VLWLLGTAFIYAAMFGVGKMLLLDWVWGLLYTALAVATGWMLARQLTREREERLLGW